MILKKSDFWNTQSMIAIIFTWKNDNIKIIEELLFNSLVSVYEIRLVTSLKDSNFVFVCAFFF